MKYTYLFFSAFMIYGAVFFDFAIQGQEAIAATNQVTSNYEEGRLLMKIWSLIQPFVIMMGLLFLLLSLNIHFKKHETKPPKHTTD